jgi:RecB family exonuclease
VGVDFQTPFSFIDDLWEVWGDGRALVTVDMRLHLVAKELSATPELTYSAKAVKQYADFASHYGSESARMKAAYALSQGEAVSPDFSYLAQHAFSAGEQAVLGLYVRYFQALEAYQLIEADAAAAYLAEGMAQGSIPSYKVEEADFIDAGPGVAKLLKHMQCPPSAYQTSHNEPLRLPSLSEAVEPRFVGAAGPAALPDALLNELEALTLTGASRLFVCTTQPEAFVEALTPWFKKHEAAVALRSELTFAQSYFGKALISYMNTRDEQLVRSAVLDFVYNPLAGVKHFDAQRIEGALANDRLLTKSAIQANLCEIPSQASFYEELLSAAEDQRPVSEDALRAFEGFLFGMSGLSRIRAAQERSVLQKCLDMMAVARSINLAPEFSAPLWEEITISFAATAQEFKEDEAGSAPAEGASVYAEVPSASADIEASSVPAEGASTPAEGASTPAEGISASAGVSSTQTALYLEFATPRYLSTLMPQSFDAVVVADLTEEAFPSTDKEDALSIFAKTLELAPLESVHNFLRRVFEGALVAPRRFFSCLLQRRNSKGEEEYLSFLFNEYLTSMAQARSCMLAAQGKPNEAQAWLKRDVSCFDIPCALSANFHEVGEDQLAHAIGRNFGAVVGVKEYEQPVQGNLASFELKNFVRYGTSEGQSYPILSPSAFETYTLCPYAWFVERRLGVSSYGEDFSALEKGNFAHEVFARFYDTLAEKGISRVDRVTLDEVLALFDVFYDDVLAEQFTRDCRENRLVSLTPSEQLECKRLKAHLAKSLELQSAFAPGFKVHGHEIEIKAEDNNFYAGALIEGRVDRIDINEQTGRFVVLDYKGSADKDYEAAMNEEDETPPLPPRIQALIYARILQGTLAGLHAAGALYLSYRAQKYSDLAAGSADNLVFSGEAAVSKKSFVPMNFEAYLLKLEEELRPFVERYEQGDIEPNPRDKCVCTYCPVPACEKRLS